MQWLNYHHLLYFWTVVKLGSVRAASEDLRLAAPTISAQIHRLEENLGEKLLQRAGRTVVPTDNGRLVFRYADEIFSLGKELVGALQGRPSGRPLRVRIGVAQVVPKLVAEQIIAPALRLAEPVHVFCREANSMQLLAELAMNELDVVLSDVPAAPAFKARLYNHLLGECGTSFWGLPKVADQYRRGFPRSLNNAPLLLPAENAALGRSLDQWFNLQDIRPRVVGEFEDHALLRVFTEHGFGIAPAPAVVDTHLKKRYGLRRIGHTEEVRSSFYAISVERRVKHPAVVAICETGKRILFGR